MYKIEATFQTSEELAQFVNTLHVVKQNRAAEKAELPKEPAADAPAKSGRGKKTDVPAPAAAAAPAEETAAITRDEALAYLKVIAEAKSIGGKDLIAFLQKEFGVPKFSDIPAKRYAELKEMADAAEGEAKPDPMA